MKEKIKLIIKKGIDNNSEEIPDQEIRIDINMYDNLIKELADEIVDYIKSELDRE